MLTVALIQRHLLFVRKTTVALDQIWNCRDTTLSIYCQGSSFPCCNIWLCSWIMRKAKQRKPDPLNCGSGENSQEYVGLPEEQASQYQMAKQNLAAHQKNE